MTALCPMGYDETSREANDRADCLYNAACDLRAAADIQRATTPLDSHVSLWARLEFERLSEAAFVQRRDERLWE